MKKLCFILTIIILLAFATSVFASENYGTYITYAGYDNRTTSNSYFHDSTNPNFKSSIVSDVSKNGKYSLCVDCTSYEDGNSFGYVYESKINKFEQYANGKLYIEGYIKLVGGEVSSLGINLNDGNKSYTYRKLTDNDGWVKIYGTVDFRESESASSKINLTINYTKEIGKDMQYVYIDSMKTVYIPDSISVAGGKVDGDNIALNSLKVYGLTDKSKSEITDTSKIEYEVIEGDAYIQNGSLICRNGGEVELKAKYFGLESYVVLDFDVSDILRVDEGQETVITNPYSAIEAKINTYVLDNGRYSYRHGYELVTIENGMNSFQHQEIQYKPFINNGSILRIIDFYK